MAPNRYSFGIVFGINETFMVNDWDFVLAPDFLSKFDNPNWKLTQLPIFQIYILFQIRSRSILSLYSLDISPPQIIFHHSATPQVKVLDHNSLNLLFWILFQPPVAVKWKQEEDLTIKI